VAQESASSESFLRRSRMRTVISIYLSEMNNPFKAASSRMQLFHPQNGGKEKYVKKSIQRRSYTDYLFSSGCEEEPYPLLF
jgi:hypothetical protein